MSAEPSRRTCIFHLGLPKTGSSSIQAFLRARPAELLEHGIRFPVAPSVVKGTATGGRIPHADLLQHFYSLKRQPVPRAIDYDREIERSRSDPPGSILLLTHEVQALHGHNARRDLFARLNKTHDIRFICYLRNPLSWLPSYYEQAVSQPNGFHAAPARHFAVRAYLDGGFRSLMAPFRDLGRLELHDFDLLRSGGELVPQFLESIGADALIPAARAAPRVNTHAYAPEQLAILRRLKAEGIEPALFVRVRELFDRFVAAFPRKRLPAVMFPADLQEALARQWQLDREALSDEVTLSDAASPPDAVPYRDDPEVIGELLAFAAAEEDTEVVAAVRRGIGATCGSALV